jgi:hypothetical protein
MNTLCDDCKYHLQRDFNIDQLSDQQIPSFALQEIQDILQHVGKTLSDFNLLNPSIEFIDRQEFSCIIFEEMNYDIEQFHVNWQRDYD